MDKEKEIIRILPCEIRDKFQHAGLDFEQIREIRLRINKPIQIIGNSGRYYLSVYGNLTGKTEQAYCIKKNDIKQIMELASNYSLYAYGNELREGFMTIEGGHRIGICGKVIQQNREITGIKYISSLNIRVSHEVIGCAEPLIPLLKKEEKLCSTLLVGPPGCGKTTLLRDMIRILSEQYTISVIDERGELSGSYMGVSTKNMGENTDILDGCQKAEGMMMALRSMGPDVIAVDEIGKKEDIEAIRYAGLCGCIMLATIHGDTMEDLSNRPYVEELIKDRIFERYVFLEKRDRPGGIREIRDRTGESLNWDTYSL